MSHPFYRKHQMPTILTHCGANQLCRCWVKPEPRERAQDKRWRAKQAGLVAKQSTLWSVVALSWASSSTRSARVTHRVYILQQAQGDRLQASHPHRLSCCRHRTSETSNIFASRANPAKGTTRREVLTYIGGLKGQSQQRSRIESHQAWGKRCAAAPSSPCLCSRVEASSLPLATSRFYLIPKGEEESPVLATTHRLGSVSSVLPDYPDQNIQA